MSGRRSSSHGSRRGNRCLTEFTFQVATRTDRTLHGTSKSPEGILRQPRRELCQHGGIGRGGGGEGGRQTRNEANSGGPFRPLQPIARTRKRCLPAPTR